MEDLVVDGEIIIKRMLKEQNV